MSAVEPFVRPFARVWGRRLPELFIEVRDPVGRGLMRAVAASAPSSRAEGGAPLLLAGVAEAEARPRCVTLSPAWGRDHLLLDALRRENADFLAPWEATLPPRFG